MIIDAHCHLGVSRARDWSQTPEELRAAMDEAGVDRACVFGFPDTVDNEAILATARADDRLIGLACVDPNKPDAADELERGLRGGLRGLRLHPYLHGFTLSMPIVDPLFEVCAQYGAPVLCHGADDAPANNPYQFLAMAERHPRVNLVALYGGFVWNVGDLAEIAARRDNVYLEVSTYAPGTLRNALTIAGPGKFIFGSGLPDGDQVVTLRRLRVALPDDEARALVLGGTMRRLLTL